MPTLLRFRGFRIMTYTLDHQPAHVHVIGSGKRAIFAFGCPAGPVILRSRFGTTSAEESAIAAFLTDHLELLCKAWETIHGV